MLSREGCVARRDLIRELYRDHDLFLISNPRHVFYLSGFLVPPTELASWGLHFLLIDRDGRSLLLTDNWGEAALVQTYVDEASVWSWYDFNHAAEDRLSSAAGTLRKILERSYSGVKSVAIDSNHLPTTLAESLDKMKLADLGPTLRMMRRCKYEDELSCIRRAIRATEAGHVAARRNISAGMTELDLYSIVHAAVVEASGEPILMMGDFAAGQRSATGGGAPTRNVLRPGDLMILDLFPIIGGYRADITNTLCVGQPSQRQRDHLSALGLAMGAAEATLRPGVTGAEVHLACSAAMSEAGLAEAFFHHTGHGLGLGHPEPPYLVPNSQEELQVGNVVTLEPGAYIEGWGGARIEHNYLITMDGFERLSNHEIGL